MIDLSRVPFSDSYDFIDVPNLLDHQRESFDKFIEEYMGEVLEIVFPVFDRETKDDSSFIVECVGYEVEEPKKTPHEAKRRGRTYAGHLYLDLRLTDRVMGDVVTNERVFFGEIPYMTPNGTFIFNGNERVIVSQIIKSPSVYFEQETNPRGVELFEAVIQPQEGTWIRFETDARQRAHVRISNAKVLLSVFLKALGFGSEEKMREVFGHNNPILEATLEADDTETEEEALIKFFKTVRPGDPQVMERAEQQFDYVFGSIERYDLDDVGRFKLNEKLGKKERAMREVLARDTNGVKKGTVITSDVFEKIKEEDIYVQTEAGEFLILDNGDRDERVLTREDVYATVSYLLGKQYGIGRIDDIDHLSNRYLRLAGKLLQREFLMGMRRVEKNMREYIRTNASGHRRRNQGEISAKNLAYVRPLESRFKEFLGSSQLSQYVDQINPLGEISNKRRATAIGPGGFTKERAGIEARDVHSTHFGRICPIETPEGASVGLINQLSVYAEVNEYGFLVAPYRRVKEGKATDEIVRLTASEEERYFIAEASVIDENGEFLDDEVLVRHNQNYRRMPKEEVEFVGISTKQPFGVGACCIPFLENDDAARVLMGANMQRQGLPAVRPDEPIVGTGLESTVARDTNASVVAREDGVVKEIKEDYILIKEKERERRYPISKFIRTNDNTCLNHFVKCHVGEKVSKGDILADSMSSNNGELAVGQNVLVAFLAMDGFNYEDSIVISDRLVKEDIFSNIHIEEYRIEVKDTRMGPEEVTKSIPNVSAKQKSKLNEDGIVEVGTVVEGGDILVGKRTPRAKEDKSPEDRLIQAIYSGRIDNYRDNSLRFEYGKPESVVIDVIRNQNKEDNAKRGTIEEIKVLVAEKRKIRTGDKMSGRHGNKGVVSIVMPEEDMPHLEDGTPVDIVLSPLGVPSRMNIGQIMETHLGMIAREQGVKYEVPVLAGGDSKEKIRELLKENDLPEDGKVQLIDGRTGEAFDDRTTVGVMYMLKLDHQVADKMHARSTGPYSLLTQQPLGGRAQNGGQRLGEMEVWALEGYGAAHTLREMLTLKSDDFLGRTRMFSAIVKGQALPQPNISESVKLLINEMRALGLDTDIVTKDGEKLFKPRYKPQQDFFKDDEQD